MSEFTCTYCGQKLDATGQLHDITHCAVYLKAENQVLRIEKNYGPRMDEFERLQAENEALIKLMEEAMTNCEQCRNVKSISSKCARCQTFYKAIIA